jgi:hypothetical protein
MALLQFKFYMSVLFYLVILEWIHQETLSSLKEKLISKAIWCLIMGLSAVLFVQKYNSSELKKLQ